MINPKYYVEDFTTLHDYILSNLQKVFSDQTEGIEADYEDYSLTINRNGEFIAEVYCEDSTIVFHLHYDLDDWIQFPPIFEHVYLQFRKQFSVHHSVTVEYRNPEE